MVEIAAKGSSSPPDLSQLKIFFWPMGLSLLIGILTVFLSEHPPQWLLYVPARIARVISGINGIAYSTEHPSAVILIMGYQWAFLPWYAAIWFFKVNPWKKTTRAAMHAKAASLQVRQRVLFVIALIYLIAYVLGDFGLIPFPTMINARWAYPLSNASLPLRPIYGSNTALMLYAWISPICEAGLWFMLCNAILNIRDFLGLVAPASTPPP